MTMLIGGQRSLGCGASRSSPWGQMYMYNTVHTKRAKATIC